MPSTPVNQRSTAPGSVRLVSTGRRPEQSPETPPVTTSTSRPANERPTASTTYTGSALPRTPQPGLSTSPTQINSRLSRRTGRESFVSRNLAPSTTDSFTTPPKAAPTRPRSRNKENRTDRFAAPANNSHGTATPLPPGDAGLLQDDGRIRVTQSPTTRLAYLKDKLKTWERQFEARNGGRKASQDDIRQNVKVAARYREYHRLRELATKSAPTLDFGDLASSRQLTEAAAAAAARPRPGGSGLGFSTPQKQRQRPPPSRPVYNATNPYRNPHPPPPDEVASVQADVHTPAAQRMVSFVGPTPQKNGLVLGLFDGLSPTKSESNQSPLKGTGNGDVLDSRTSERSKPHSGMLDVPTVGFSTPKRARPDAGEDGDDDDDERARDGAWTGRARKWQRTPASEGKKFFMGMFVTPTRKPRVGTTSSDPRTAHAVADPHTGVVVAVGSTNGGHPFGGTGQGTTTPMSGQRSMVVVEQTPTFLRRESAGLGLGATVDQSWSGVAGADILGAITEQDEKEVADELAGDGDDEVNPLGVSSFAGRLSRATSTANTPAGAGAGAQLSLGRSGSARFSLAGDDGELDVDEPIKRLDDDEDLPQALRNVLKSDRFLPANAPLSKSRSGSVAGTPARTSPTAVGKPGLSTASSSLSSSLSARPVSAKKKSIRLPFGAGAGGRTFSTVIERMRNSERERREKEERERERALYEATTVAWDEPADQDFSADEAALRELEMEEAGAPPVPPARRQPVDSDVDRSAMAASEPAPTAAAVDASQPESKASARLAHAIESAADDPFSFKSNLDAAGDRFDENLENMEFDSEPEGTTTTRKWKKKGQKRTTKLFKMKPAVRIGPTSERDGGDDDGAADVGSDADVGARAANPSAGPDGQGQTTTTATTTTTAAKSDIKTTKSRSYDPNAVSNMNYRRLHIKDRGAKKRQFGRGRFRR